MHSIMYYIYLRTPHSRSKITNKILKDESMALGDRMDTVEANTLYCNIYQSLFSPKYLVFGGR